ncbi:MAG TPA: NADH-quinone oxidoreductase subunit N [Bacteroidales bacterium]|nr:NADH-quinone oxidoreductase subunit N [Bacteroidales bacterium]
MNRSDFLCLTPLLIVAGAPILIMLTVAFRRNFRVIYGFSLLAFLAAFLSVILLKDTIPHSVSSLFVMDGFTAMISAIILFACMAVTVFSKNFILVQESEKEEYFIILFVAALGSLLLAGASHLVTLFLGLETLSVSLYILTAYRRALDRSVEASVKYLILASVSSAFLLFGMGLIYMGTGSLTFSGIASSLAAPGSATPILLTGFSMMLAGLGFKLALVPFHMWTPDVYQGAPLPVTMYIATVSKGAVMALFLRLFLAVRGAENSFLVPVITGLAVLSMFFGNLLAIRQQNIKRILAYSSISNMGYLLVTLLISSGEGIPAAVFYILSYTLTTLGAFGVITLVSKREQDAEMVEDYRGLFWKKPWIAIVFTLALLSLAGIPLTTGFMAKFYLVFAGVHSGLWLLVISLIVNSVIGLYYYLRVIVAMFSMGNDHEFAHGSVGDRILLAILAVGILGIGILPQWIFHLIVKYSQIF